MTISEMAYRRRAVVYLVTVLLMVTGAYNYFTLPAREDPEIIIREALVTTEYPGLSAERMELLVTKTLEESVRQIPEVEQIRSVTQAGLSIIHVELHDRIFELDQVWDELRAKVSATVPELPEGTQTPVVFDDFGDVAVVTAALTSDDFSQSDMFDMAKHVRDLLYSVPGTKRVDLLGVQPERVYVEARNARLAEFGLDPESLSRVLAAQNIILPGGQVDTGDRAFIIEPSGNYDDLDAIRETLIRLPGGAGVVPLRDLAEVRRGYHDPPITKAYYNGEPAIVFAMAMVGQNSVLSFGARAKQKLDEIRQTLPVGYQLDIITHQADQVGKAVYGVSFSVLQTVFIVLIVVVWFLGLRTGLIVGSIVPAVMLASLGIMGFAGMQLERMSLATLVIALGILVDNGIVVAEDYKRRMEEGVSRDEAMRQTGRELAFPLLASSLTTILVFLPLMLAEHVAGEYTRSVSLVILITLSTSWLMALLLTPSLCHRFIRIEPQRQAQSKSGFLAGLEHYYGRLLRGILRHRLLFMAGMTVLLFAAVAAMSLAPKEFFPGSDRTQVIVYLDLPAGVTTRTTDDVINRMFTFMNDRERFPHIESYAAYLGFGGPRFVLSLTPIDRAPNKAFFMINVDRYENMDTVVSGLRELYTEQFPQAHAEVARMFLGPSDAAKLELQIKGPDADYIYETARKMTQLVATVPGAINIKQDWENRITKLVVNVDQARARRAGVTSADIARSLARYFSGERITEFREGDDVIPIVVRGVDAERENMERVRSLAVYPREPGGNRSAGVPLFQVAEFELRNEFARIEREDMMRTITIEARNTRMTGEDMVPLLKDGLDELRAGLPLNHVIEYDGAVAEAKEAQAAMQANAPLCFIIIFVLLVTLFNSYLRPVIIFLTVPLIVIGVAIGLFVMRASFGFMEILGIYALAGIIMNNAIVLINRFDIERAEPGKSDFEAIVSASMRRLRPILMTTATTILGLMPLIVGQDALFYGMSSVIAFGLGVGTILTLGVTPVLYSLVFRIRPE